MQLLKNNDNRNWSDTEWVREFFNFLMGEIPEGMRIARGHQPKMSAKKAETIIWYLQEHFPIIPDNIEKCASCDLIFDYNSQGEYSEKTGKVKCDNCL